jgi:hypothetical protein
MKKLFTLFLVALTAIAVRATDYNVPITVIVNGVTSEQTAVITIVENDGLYDLTLRNFMLQSEDGPMGVGNVELKGMKPCQDGNATLLLTNEVINISVGDDPDVPFWMASILPPVPVNLRGKIEGGHLRCFIDIDLVEALGQVIQVAIGDGYQMPNPGFEAWHTSADDYVEPDGWHSFESATGALATLAGHHLTKSADAHSGEASARIYATSIFGIVANGTMTTGRMNAGSMTATDLVNHAYLDMTMTDVDGKGNPYYVPLYSRPDSVAVWVKFKQGKANAAHPYATLSAVITDGTRYQDPEDQDYTNVVARAKNNMIATTGGQWVRIAVPFVYTENAVDPQAVLITVSTNADAGQGSANDEVLVDDIEFIYNATVTRLTIKGQNVKDFRADRTSYEMELNAAVTADDIDVAVDGQATHIAKTVEIEDDCYVCHIAAIGADMSAMSNYVVRVKSLDTAIRSRQQVANLPATYFALDGRQVNTLAPGKFYIRRLSDGTTQKIHR